MNNVIYMPITEKNGIYETMPIKIDLILYNSQGQKKLIINKKGKYLDLKI